MTDELKGLVVDIRRAVYAGTTDLDPCKYFEASANGRCLDCPYYVGRMECWDTMYADIVRRLLAIGGEADD